MTNPSTVPGDAIRALVEERERYESWLAALDARRGATPAHVFERVQGDYDARLRGVRERLAEHVGPLRDAESALARRQDEVVRRLTERQDELAELELRTLVGEFPAEDGERRVQQAAADVRELDGERRAVVEQLTELRALLAQASGTPQAADETPAPTTPTAAPAESPSSATAADAVTGVAAGAAVAEGARPEPELTEALDRASQRTSDAPEAWQPPSARASADDEGFVGTGARLDSLAASLGGAVAPPAAPAAGNQERTLRCQECGEMNYPTEWYCERCGGELAAL